MLFSVICQHAYVHDMSEYDARVSVCVEETGEKETGRNRHIFLLKATFVNQPNITLVFFL